MIFTLAVIALALAALSAALFVRNLFLFFVPAAPKQAATPRVSVLIPARNEEANIAEVLKSVLTSRGVVLEVLVGDDNSDDQTSGIVQKIANRDSRVRLVSIPHLPIGWNGKQHACWVLAKAASSPVLSFIDADVRLAPDALARSVEYVTHSGAALVSGFPREITGTWLEKLLLPLIQFVLLGYLPIDGMRRSTSPAYAAGCGQLMLVLANEYHKVGGHSAIRASRHDGLTLPAAFRHKGYGTDLFDATPLAACHMYSNAREVWEGLVKNATEGMATPIRLPIFTLLLAGGHVLPFVLLALSLLQQNAQVAWISAAAVVLSLAPRVLGVKRFRQPLISALLHPLGVSLLLSVQFYALLRQLLGRPATWRGRTYSDNSNNRTEVITENAASPATQSEIAAVHR